jgi:hypothetical protein
MPEFFVGTCGTPIADHHYEKLSLAYI